MENLKQYIIRRLSELDMTRLGLAKKLGISKVHMSNLINGKEHMSVDRLKSIYSVVGVPDMLTESTKESAGKDEI